METTTQSYYELLKPVDSATVDVIIAQSINRINSYDDDAGNPTLMKRVMKANPEAEDRARESMAKTMMQKAFRELAIVDRFIVDEQVKIEAPNASEIDRVHLRYVYADTALLEGVKQDYYARHNEHDHGAMVISQPRRSQIGY